MIRNNSRAFSKVFDSKMFTEDATNGLPKTITTNKLKIKDAKRLKDMLWEDSEGIERSPLIISVFDEYIKKVKLYERNDNSVINSETKDDFSTITYDEITPLGKIGNLIEIYINEENPVSKLQNNNSDEDSNDDSQSEILGNDINIELNNGQSESDETIMSTESPTQPSTNVAASEYTNHSGGAYGGDTFWDIIGREFGVTKHMHYKDAGNANLSQKLRNAGVKATVLTKEQMNKARTEVERLLGENYPDTLQGNLQVRNYYQVANSDAVFAVAEIAPSTKPEVFGGTNTAVQLAIKMNKPVYVFDLDTNKWYTQDLDFLANGYDNTKHNFDYNGWKEINTPTLTKNFAGIGSRDIESYNVQKDGKWVPRVKYKGKETEEAAKQAIRDVYENTFKPTQPSTSVESKTSSIPSERQIKVEQFNITIKPDGKMFYENGNEVTDQTTKNKVNVRKELQDKTLRSSVYNGANYFVLSDDRIVGSGKTNLGKESITDNTIKEKILAKAVTYKKEC
jgi:hypothetical protein